VRELTDLAQFSDLGQLRIARGGLDSRSDAICSTVTGAMFSTFAFVIAIGLKLRRINKAS